MPKSTTIPVWELKELHNNYFGSSYTNLGLVQSLPSFHINKVQDYRDKIRFPLPPHRKAIHDFIFLTKGATIRKKALNPYEIEENTFFFLPAYQITEHKYMSKDVEGFFCQFNFDIFTNHLPQHNVLRNFLFLQFISDPVIKIDAETRPFIINILERLELEYLKGKECNLVIVSTYLFTLFTEINRFYTPSVSTKKNAALTITEQFKDALVEHIYVKQKISEYSELLNISPNHLNKCVKTATGRLAQDLLYEMILLEAKVMLKQTDMPINEIAYKLTKQDHSSFSRFFKTHTGLKPIDYRNTLSF